VVNISKKITKEILDEIKKNKKEIKKYWRF
jgi:hypothetical protein